MPILREQTMTISTPESELASPMSRPSKAMGWVVAALTVHLLVTSVATAATSGSGTIERTRVTRLSSCVAQVIRELVDHAAESTAMVVIERDSEPLAAVLVADTGCMEPEGILVPWMHDLPPPAWM
tara:strand:- start:906 stop:1283 length:378 start_codon:yes stop_codon:yes gene_type:complete